MSDNSTPVVSASAQRQLRSEVARLIKAEYVDDLTERHASNILVGANGVIRTLSRTGSLHDYDPERPLRRLADEIAGTAGNEARIRYEVTEEDLERKRAGGAYQL